MSIELSEFQKNLVRLFTKDDDLNISTSYTYDFTSNNTTPIFLYLGSNGYGEESLIINSNDTFSINIPSLS